MGPGIGYNVTMDAGERKPATPLPPELPEVDSPPTEDVLADVPSKEEIVDQAIQLKIPAVWMQEGVINERAAEKACNAGMFVAMDLCILKEHRARFR